MQPKRALFLVHREQIAKQAMKSYKKVLGNETEIFDGGEGTARETKRQIESLGLLNKSESKGKIEYITSSDDKNELEFLKKIYEINKG